MNELTAAKESTEAALVAARKNVEAVFKNRKSTQADREDAQKACAAAMDTHKKALWAWEDAGLAPYHVQGVKCNCCEEG